jgi:hypothetical protein
MYHGYCIDLSFLLEFNSPGSATMYAKFSEVKGFDQIKKDLENTLTTINNIYEKSDTNILWNTFKNDIINSIESNIPHKLFTYKQRLPCKYWLELLVKNVRFFYCISIEYTIFFQWAYARVFLSNAFEVAKKLFWFKIRVLMLIGVTNPHKR